MGCISHFDIAGLIETYGLQYFVETGVGAGISLVHMVNCFPMRGYYSCDWDEIHARGARYALRQAPDVHIALAKSTEFLESVLDWLPKERPILFWLDAHFADWTDERAANMYLPLADELSIIRRLRPEGRDVIAMDDAAIYVEGDFQLPLSPNVRPWCPKDRNIDFVHEALGGTHEIKLLYADGGYILATPRQ